MILLLAGSVFTEFAVYLCPNLEAAVLHFFNVFLSCFFVTLDMATRDERKFKHQKLAFDLPANVFARNKILPKNDVIKKNGFHSSKYISWTVLKQ